MKVLSKYLKVALCFMAFALCSFMFAFTPTMTAVSATNFASDTYAGAIQALKMPSIVANNGEFVVPAPKGTNDVVLTDYTICVVDPSGSQHNYNVVKDTPTGVDTAYFETTTDGVKVLAKNDGDYKVFYKVTHNSKTYYSNTYTVSVENVNHVLDFSSPALKGNEVVGTVKHLVKSNLALGSTYTLPVAYAKEEDADWKIEAGLVTDAVATIKVLKDGVEEKIGESTRFVYEDGKYKLVTTTEKDGDGNFKDEGVYTVEYSYSASANRPTKTFTINVESGYEAEELTLASTPTITGVELGKEVTLPKITVNAGDNKNVDVNITSVVIQHTSADKSHIKHTLTNNNLTFTMSPENFGASSYAEMKGNYHITYTVEDANGKTLTKTFKVDGVTVSSDPTLKLAYNFETDKLDNVKTGAEVELKSEYTSIDATEAGFMLPAVVAEDAVTTNYSDFVVIRAIRKGSTYYYVDNIKYNESTGEIEIVNGMYSNAAGPQLTSVSDVSTLVNTNKAQKFKFDEDATNIEGTYYLEYKVYTKQVVERSNNLYIDGTKDKYTFKISANVTASTPELEILNLKNSTVKVTDEITVKLSATDSKDSRLKNVVFTYTSRNEAKIDGKTDVQCITDAINSVIDSYDKATNILESTAFATAMANYFNGFTIVEETDVKNSFELSFTNAGTVHVMAISLNDFAHVATETKTLTVVDPASDTDEPVITISNEGKLPSAKIGQDADPVKLPTIKVADAFLANGEPRPLNLNVMYYINSPENSFGGIEYRSPVGKSFYSDSTGYYIDGGTITPSERGVYYIAYTATDMAGNTSVMYFTFEVEDTSKPILTVEPVTDASISGNTLTGGRGTVVDFETVLKSADGASDYTNATGTTIKVTVDDNGKELDYQPSGNSKNSYIFNDYGTYTVKVEAKYNNGTRDLVADSKIVKVVIEKQNIEWLGEFDVPTYATINQKIYLPDVAASGNAVVKVTYQTPGSTSDETVDAVKETDGNYTYWTFTTNGTSKGTYTVTYTATNNDDVLTKTLSIKVGDNVAPVLSFNVGELTQDLIYNGANAIEYVLEVNKSNKTFVVKAINNGEEVYSYNIGLKISDKDDNGSINSNMSWTNLEYELVGDNVTKGDSTTTDKTTKTTYTINGTGKYSLKLTMKDSYDNVTTKTIDFKVVTKGEAKENKDNVVGAVLIVISLVLLAGVILFFTFTGKKGKKSSGATKTKRVKTTKQPKVEKTEEVVEEAKEVEETQEEVVEEKETEVEDATEEVEETEAEVETQDDEPKSGEVE